MSVKETQKTLRGAQANLAKAKAGAQDADKALRDAQAEVKAAVLNHSKATDAGKDVPKRERNFVPAAKTQKK